MTLPQVLEALLFASPKPLTLAEMRAALKSAAEFTEEPLAAALARCRDQDMLDALTPRSPPATGRAGTPSSWPKPPPAGS